MIFFYVFIIAVPCLLIGLISVKIAKEYNIKRNGIETDALVSNVQTQHFSRGSFDRLTLEYKTATGIVYHAAAIAKPNRYKAGDTKKLFYLAHDPAKHLFDNGKNYKPLLIFCIILLLFVIFASYKIDQMLKVDHYKNNSTNSQPV